MEADHSPKEAEESKMHNVSSIPDASSEYVKLIFKLLNSATSLKHRHEVKGRSVSRNTSLRDSNITCVGEVVQN